MFPDAGFTPIPDATAAAERRWRYRLDEHGRCFAGHFAGAPILPAVAQLALVLEACAQGGLRGVPTGLRDLRLTRPLVPGDEVEVACFDAAPAPSVRFEIRRGGELASTGTLLMAAGGEARG